MNLTEEILQEAEKTSNKINDLMNNLNFESEYHIETNSRSNKLLLIFKFNRPCTKEIDDPNKHRFAEMTSLIKNQCYSTSYRININSNFIRGFYLSIEENNLLADLALIRTLLNTMKFNL